jgi:hypothetical protein
MQKMKCAVLKSDAGKRGYLLLGYVSAQIACLRPG